MRKSGSRTSAGVPFVASGSRSRSAVSIWSDSRRSSALAPGPASWSTELRMKPTSESRCPAIVVRSVSACASRAAICCSARARLACAWLRARCSSRSPSASASALICAASSWASASSLSATRFAVRSADPIASAPSEAACGEAFFSSSSLTCRASRSASAVARARAAASSSSSVASSSNPPRKRDGELGRAQFLRSYRHGLRSLHQKRDRVEGSTRGLHDPSCKPREGLVASDVR